MSIVESAHRGVYQTKAGRGASTQDERVGRRLKDGSGSAEMIALVRQPFLQAVFVVFGGTLAVQAVAFVRQLVIASAFGVDRAMDIYILVLTVAAVVGFGIGAVIDSAAVPLLVHRLERSDREGFRQIATRVFIIGILLGISASLAFLAVVPLVAIYVTTGLGPAERAAMSDLAWWFAPWVALSAPFYATGSLVKTMGHFRRFVIAELLVTIVSLAVLLFWRPGLHAVPVAYGLGYACAWLTLLPGLPLTWPLERHADSRGRIVITQIARFGIVAQIGALGALVDRFLASHLPAGAIAAGSYSTLITNQVTTLLSLREAFMVPLSESERRSERLSRLIAASLMLSVPCAFFLSHQAQPIVGVLLERGRFDGLAVALAAQMLAFQAIGVPISIVNLLVFRMLQIMGRLRFAALLMLASSLAGLVVGSALMFGMGLGLYGYLLSQVIVLHLTFALSWLLLRVAGLQFDLMDPVRFAAYAAAASLAGLYAGSLVEIGAGRFLTLLKDGAIFAIIYLLACLAIRGPLRRLTGPLRAL